MQKVNAETSLGCTGPKGPRASLGVPGRKLENVDPKALARDIAGRAPVGLLSVPVAHQLKC